jgi:hypothetical protein
MHLAAVGEHRGLTVQHDRVGLPCVPQLGHQIGEIVGKIVAFVVRRLLGMTIVLRRTVIAAGDAVPSDTPLGNVIERIDQPRQQEGRVLRH